MFNEYEAGATAKSEEDFAYCLYGIPAVEIAAMVNAVCRPENRKNTGSNRAVITTKFVADLLGNRITILRLSSAFFDDYDKMEERRYRQAGIPYAKRERSEIVEYHITTDEWDLKLKVHHGMIDATYPAESARGVGKIGGQKCMLYSPWIDGDTETYLSQMSILRLMLPMMMEDAA